MSKRQSTDFRSRDLIACFLVDLTNNIRCNDRPAARITVKCLRYCGVRVSINYRAAVEYMLFLDGLRVEAKEIARRKRKEARDAAKAKDEA